MIAHRFDPNSAEEYLSKFGQTLLHHMVPEEFKQWHKIQGKMCLRLNVVPKPPSIGSFLGNLPLSRSWSLSTSAPEKWGVLNVKNQFARFTRLHRRSAPVILKLRS